VYIVFMTIGRTEAKRRKRMPTSVVLSPDIDRRIKSGGWNRSNLINAALYWFLERPELRDSITELYAGRSDRKHS
jgi:hypothetical protein